MGNQHAILHNGGGSNDPVELVAMERVGELPGRTMIAAPSSAPGTMDA